MAGGRERRRYRDWDFEYDGAAPRLPRPLKKKEEVEAVNDYLPQGAYFIWFKPTVAESEIEVPRVYAGVLRVHTAKCPKTEEKGKSECAALATGSGDLYVCDYNQALARKDRLLAKDESTNLEMSDEIERLKETWFPRNAYRYYLRLHDAKEVSKKGFFVFTTESYDGPTKGWEKRQSISLEISAEPKLSAQVPTSANVTNGQGTSIGTLFLVRVTTRILRHADVRVHYYDQTKAPVDECQWKKSLRRAQWSVAVKSVGPAPNNNNDKLDKGGENWSHHALKTFHKENIEPNSAPEEDAWLYNVLVVNKIRLATGAEPLGFMYDLDRQQKDLPRQGAAVAAERQINDKCLYEHELLFNTVALHELGHMQGLYHNPLDGLMRIPIERATPGVLASLGSLLDQGKFPKHERQDLNRLRHLPDLWVRPGGVPFGYRYRESALEVQDLVPHTEGLVLDVEPFVARMGGRPHELVLRLENRSSQCLLCPSHRQAQPEYGRLGIYLDTPSGKEEEIWPLRYPRQLPPEASSTLWPGESIEYRIPWQRPDFPLLPDAGLYRVSAHLVWAIKGEASGSPPQPKVDLYRVSGQGNLSVQSRDASLEEDELFLEVEATWVARGKRPRELGLRLINRSDVGLLCPNAAQFQPQEGRLGVSVESPSGKCHYVWPTAPPRRLEKPEATSLHVGETVEVRIPLNSSSFPILEEFGTYRVYAALSWSLDERDERNVYDLNIARRTRYRARGVGQLHVSESPYNH